MDKNEKFAKYLDFYNAYYNLEYIRHWINVVFCSKEFQANVTYPAEIKEQLEFGTTAANACDKRLGNPQYFFKHVPSKKQVETLCKGFPVVFFLSISPRSKEEDQRAVGIVKKFFPEFKVPTNWTVGTDDNGMKAVIPLFQKQSVRFSLKELRNLSVSYTPDSKASEADKLYLATERDNDKYHFIENIEVELSIVKAKTDIPTEYVSVDMGSLAGMQGSMSFVMNVDFHLCFPEDYALWATHAKTMDEFVPTQFIQLVNQVAAFSEIDGAPEPMNRIKSLGVIHKENDAVIRKGERRVRPRVNPDNFIMLKNGHIMWLPEADNVKSYEEIVRKSFDPKTGFAKDAKSIGVSNKPLYLDWLHNMYTFVNAEGNLDYISLIGGIPLSSQTIARLLVTSIDTYGKDFFAILNKWHRSPIEFNYRGKQLGYSLNDCFNVLNSVGVTWGMLGTKQNPLTLTDQSPTDTKVAIYNTPKMEQDKENSLEEEGLGDYKDLVDKLQPIFLEAMRDFAKIDCSLQQKMRVLRLCLVLVTKYAPMKKQFMDSYETNKRLNSYRFMGRPDKVTTVNLPGLKSFMPHQSRIHAELDQNPPATMLGVDAGGGKTLTIVDYCTGLLYKKIAKRILIIMPDGLVKNFISSINEFSLGHINAFPLKTSVMDRLSSSLDYKFDKVKSLILGMPINTVFVAGYNFVKSKRGIDGITKDNFLYCTKEISVYPNAELLIECDFDTVILDESHRTRNEESQLTIATSMVMAQAERKVLASGTLITNTQADYVGQMSMVDPTVFGSKDQFNDRFGEDVSNGKIITPIENSAAQIRSSMIPYVKIVNVKRREWGPFLPKLHEFTHTVRLTIKQQEFYEDLMNKAMSELLSDPKYKKILKSAKPEDEEKIEAALRRYLAGVEIFINAPDSNAAFLAQNKGNEQDLISPKVHKINELLDAHFNGGTVDEEIIKPSKGKVLIFSYNKVVSPHIFKYLKYKRKAVLVRTGDEESLTRFKEDPNILIGVFDEEGIKEGENLQMATRFIRVQTVWNPGDQDQSLARMMRPDPSDKFGRTDADYDWIMTEMSIEIAKVARMFSKVIAKARNDEYGQPGWYAVDKELEDLPLIKMNLDIIKEYKTDSDLDEYWNAYAKYRHWEFGQFDVILDRYKEEYRKAYGKEPTRQELMDHVLVPTEHLELPNSKKAYVPYVEGMITPVDNHGLDLKPLVLMESSEDEDDSSESVQVQSGDHVWTEFGPAQVTGVRKRQIKVKVSGIGEVNLPKSVVFVSSDFGEVKSPKQNKLASLYKLNKNGSMTMKPGYTSSVEKVQIAPSITKLEKEKTPVKKVSDQKPSSVKRAEKKTFDIIPANINNQIALFTVANKDVTRIVGSGWRYNDPFLYTMVKTKQGFDNLLKGFQKKNLKIGSKYLENLEILRDRITQGERKFMQNTALKLSDIQNFFRIAPRPVTDSIRPYPLFWGGVLHVAVNARTHSKFLSKIRSVNVPGCTTWKLNPAIVIKFFPTRQAAVQEIEKISKKVEVTNYDMAMKELKTLTVKKSTR